MLVADALQQHPNGAQGRRPGLVVSVSVAVLALLAVMTVRLALPCDGDPGCFVVAGAAFTDAEEAGIPVLDGPGRDGYDGQFYWRLSRSPDELRAAEVHGVVLDTPIRVGRPAYPAVVWAVSGGGRKGVVDAAMVAVNMVATALLSLLLAATARRSGVSPWLGALAALWPGLLFAVGRDLAEPGSALLVVAGLAALSRHRPELAAVSWAGAVLWREQAIVVPAAYGLVWLVTLARRPRDAAAVTRVLPWLAPLAAFLLWQAVAARAVGAVPVLASGDSNAVLPLTGLLPEAAGWVLLEDGALGLVWLFELGVALLIVTAAVVTGVRSRQWEVVAVLAGLALLLSASTNVWTGPAHLRYATDLVMTSWFVLLTSQDAARSGRWHGTLRRWGGYRGALLALQLVAALVTASFLVRTP